MVASCQDNLVRLAALELPTAAYDNLALQTDCATVNLDGRCLDEPAKLETIAVNDVTDSNADVTGSTLSCDAADAPVAPADDENWCTHAMLYSRSLASACISRHSALLWLIFKVILVLLYHSYLISAIHYAVVYGDGIYFCDGVGFLIIITVLVYWSVFYYQILKPLVAMFVDSYTGKVFQDRVWNPLTSLMQRIWSLRVVRMSLGALVLAAILLYLILDTSNNRTRLVSAFGIVVFILLCWLCSHNPGKVIWRQVIWGIGLQIVFGLIILRWKVGQETFDCIGEKINSFLAYTDEGSKFVFGSLVGGKSFFFAFSVLPVIIFFSFAIQILYYYGVMQVIILKIGWLLQVTVGTTACESLNAAANIFVGQSEAPLLIKPYITQLTMSELHAIMTGGFATIAGSVLAAYVSFGVSPAHLLSASVMSAPAALAISKLVYPETRRSRTTIGDISVQKGDEVNALDAASRGAMSVVKICGYIAASLIAFIAFIAFVNGVLGWAGELVGFTTIFGAPLSFELIVSRVFRPLAWLMGAPWSECGHIGELIAIKTILNEFVAYSRLQEMVNAGMLSPRSIVIATYALCGFSNLGAMGIQISGLSAMAPDRRSDLARLAFSAMMAGNVACFLTACVAGTLIDDPSTVGSALATTEVATTLVVNVTQVLATTAASFT